MSFGFKLSGPQSGLNSQHLSSCSDSGRYCQSYRCSVGWCHRKWCWLWPARTDKMLVMQAAVEQQQPVAWHGTSWATCAWCVFTGLHWSWLLALLAARVVGVGVFVYGGVGVHVMVVVPLGFTKVVPQVNSVVSTNTWTWFC